MCYLSGVVLGPVKPTLSTHVLSRVSTALSDRGAPLTAESVPCARGAGLLPVNKYALQRNSRDYSSNERTMVDHIS